MVSYSIPCKLCGACLVPRIIQKGAYTFTMRYVCPICGWEQPQEKITYSNRTSDYKGGDTE